jgi:hypothetical protein
MVLCVESMLPVLWLTTSSTKVNDDVPYDFMLDLPQPNRELSSATNSALYGISVLYIITSCLLLVDKLISFLDRKT